MTITTRVALAFAGTLLLASVLFPESVPILVGN